MSIPEIEAHKHAATLASANPRVLNPLPCGEFSLSIQASDFHYSTPSVTLPWLSDYTHVEVALLRNDQWFDVRAQLPDLAPLFDELNFEGGYQGVAGYVAWPDVERLYTALAGVEVTV